MNMIRLILLLALPLAVGACSTPRDTCLKSASRDIAVVDRLIAETQANLARGYGVKREPYTSTSLNMCYGGGRYRYGAPGIGLSYCATPTTRYRNRPVAIDRAAEQRKLTELRQTRSRLVAETNQRLEQCNRLYPAG